LNGLAGTECIKQRQFNPLKPERSARETNDMVEE